MSNHGHRWTTEEVIDFMSRWNRGDSIPEMAEHFGCSRYGINKQVTRLRRDGVYLARRTKGRGGEDSGALRSQQLWTSEETEYLIRRRHNRASIEEIAVELGRSVYAINGMVQQLRKSGVKVPIYGSGQRKLWDADEINQAIAARHVLAS